MQLKHIRLALEEDSFDEKCFQKFRSENENLENEIDRNQY